MKPHLIEKSRNELKIEFQDEGHSFCNFLRKTLLEMPSVEFAGCNIDHPLLSSPIVTIRTTRRQANVVLREGLETMLARTEEFRKKFTQALSDHSVD